MSNLSMELRCKISLENYFKLSNIKIFSAIKSGGFYSIDCKQCALCVSSIAYGLTKVKYNLLLINCNDFKINLSLKESLCCHNTDAQQNTVIKIFHCTVPVLYEMRFLKFCIGLGKA